MDNPAELNEKQLDEMLADFTDRIMDVEEAEDLEFFTDNEQYKGLQETVVVLKRTLGRGQPAPEVESRIRANLIEEWHRSWKIKPGKSASPGKTWISSASRRRANILRLAMAIIFVGIAALILSPVVGIPLVGTAGNGNTLTFILIIALLAAGTLFILFSNRK